MTKRIGRRNPPVETRFRKGQSGNPGGRPKGRRTPTPRPSAFDILFDRTLDVEQNGRTREMTVDEALEQSTYKRAVNGDRKASREVLKMIVAREKALGGQTVLLTATTWKHEADDPDNADDALQLLAIARLCQDDGRNAQSDEPGLLLESWAVQLALGRRGFGDLPDDAIYLIKQSTAQPELLVFPKRGRHG